MTSAVDNIARAGSEGSQPQTSLLMPHILIVCTANICRSPVAEGLLQQRLDERGMVGWSVASAGTWAVQARGAADNSVKLLAAQGIDISDHRARMINEELLQEADLVLCMEIGHVEALRIEFPEYAWKIFTLSETVGKQFSVADPYGGPIEEFERMIAEVSQLVDEGLPFIIGTAGKNARKRWGID